MTRSEISVTLSHRESDDQQAVRNARTPKIRTYLRRSQFIVGLAKAIRGLSRDLHVLIWLVQRKRKNCRISKSPSGEKAAARGQQ